MMKNSLIFTMVMCVLITSNSVWADITAGLIGYWPLDEGSGTCTWDGITSETQDDSNSINMASKATGHHLIICL